MRTKIKNIYLFLIVVAFSAGMFSCKSSQEIVRVENLKPLSPNRLLNNLEKSAFDYKAMEMSRISCQYESRTQNVSFRAVVKAVNNEAILLTFSKMNVPVGKVLLTPDSVKFINFIERSYFTGNYDYISNLLGIDIDFEIVNAILSNNAFSFRDDKFREFTADIDSGMYVLKSVKDRKLDKVMKKGKDKKIDRLLKRFDENDFIEQTLFVDSKFKLRKIILDDPLNQRMGIISFSEFMKVGRQMYPGEINMQFVSPKDRLQLKIKIGKLTMEKNQNLNFKIPERYQQIK